ncbi:hypothetical protein ACFWY6_45340, partial [Streptomyces sp. NPDC059037]
MPRFAANLSMMYTEHDFLDRFAAASADGFDAVEYLFPYDHEPTELRRRLDDHGLRQVLFNAPPGDWESGERGMGGGPPPRRGGRGRPRAAPPRGGGGEWGGGGGSPRRAPPPPP